MRPHLIHKSTAQTDRGITLIELVIAILVLTIGTLSVLRTLDQSRRELGGATARFLAQSVAANRAEELRTFGAGFGRGLPETVQQGPFMWAIETTSKQTDAGLYEMTLTVTSPDQPGVRLVSYTTWDPQK